MDRIEIGMLGEDYAEESLVRDGYVIVKRNYRCKYGEIDIIAYKDGVHVFVEVKTRKGNLYGEPAEAVNYFKQQKIMRSALFYMKRDDIDMRFDVFEVIYAISDGEFVVKGSNHIKNAF